MDITLHEGDNRAVLKGMIERGEFVHSVVCDPPYGLTSVTKRFGKQGSAPPKHGTDGAFARMSRGFMGKVWDGTAIERDPEFWQLVFDVMLPGAYVVAFSSSRTYHHMAIAMEMAGFITHPMIGWVFGSGMTKPTHVGLPGWEGWRYGTQSRKPAMEPIYVGQKPFSEKTGRLNILKHGVGAVNIDGCRVDGDRWPANLILDGSDEVVALFPYSKGQLADASTNTNRCANQNVYGAMRSAGTGKARNDEGSAARFFNCYPFEDEPVFYCRKANKQDRNGSTHPTVKPIALLRDLVRHVTPPGGTVLDPFAGSGTTGQAAREEGVSAILIEMEPEYCVDIRRRLNLPVSRFAHLLGEALPAQSTKSCFEDMLE